MRLKSWETPRKEGRNIKGKGGHKRRKQIAKKHKNMAKLLK